MMRNPLSIKIERHSFDVCHVSFSEVSGMMFFKPGTVMRYMYHGGLMHVKPILALSQNMSIMNVFSYNFEIFLSCYIDIDA